MLNLPFQDSGILKILQKVEEAFALGLEQSLLPCQGPPGRRTPDRPLEARPSPEESPDLPCLKVYQHVSGLVHN